ncbi:hypothetical protein HHK36_016820 [Tetracentron sinense]|uniref:Tyrosine specific protein phosphatases domain-containing protein n=1 Tax=Tetracentron sinense TaxID=13715 RepID=A0A834Z071_TETSI|nr:hypothetical protein HHK36_016820 [Tetracentron sinense]
MGLGISRLIGLKATVLFLAFAYLRGLGLTLLPVPLLFASVVDFLVSIASHPSINLPLFLGKSTDGILPLWSRILFGPFLYFVRIFGWLRRLRSKEPPYTEICEGLYVGGWPYSVDTLPPGDPAVIDCTCELPRSEVIMRNAYLCIPTWDTRAPQPGEIESAVGWACRKRAQKRPVFIHCAFAIGLHKMAAIVDLLKPGLVLFVGHGRSVAVMCALIVALGMAEDWKNAEKIIQERRPCIRMNALHRKSLEEWSKHRLSSKRTDELGVSSVILSAASGSSRSKS